MARRSRSSRPRSRSRSRSYRRRRSRDRHRDHDRDRGGHRSRRHRRSRSSSRSSRSRSPDRVGRIHRSLAAERAALAQEQERAHFERQKLEGAQQALAREGAQFEAERQRTLTASNLPSAAGSGVSGGDWWMDEPTSGEEPPKNVRLLTAKEVAPESRQPQRAAAARDPPAAAQVGIARFAGGAVEVGRRPSSRVDLRPADDVRPHLGPRAQLRRADTRSRDEADS